MSSPEFVQASSWPFSRDGADIACGCGLGLGNMSDVMADGSVGLKKIPGKGLTGRLCVCGLIGIRGESRKAQSGAQEEVPLAPGLSFIACYRF
jgi:hypothetical protein